LPAQSGVVSDLPDIDAGHLVTYQLCGTEAMEFLHGLGIARASDPLTLYASPKRPTQASTKRLDTGA
jgi:hypothetical protein